MDLKTYRATYDIYHLYNHGSRHVERIIEARSEGDARHTVRSAMAENVKAQIVKEGV